MQVRQGWGARCGGLAQLLPLRLPRRGKRNENAANYSENRPAQRPYVTPETGIWEIFGFFLEINGGNLGNFWKELEVLVLVFGIFFWGETCREIIGKLMEIPKRGKSEQELGRTD